MLIYSFEKQRLGLSPNSCLFYPGVSSLKDASWSPVKKVNSKFT